KIDYLPTEVISAKPALSGLKKECLMLVDSSDEYSADYLKEMRFVLDSMSVGYDEIDVTKSDIPSFEKYETVALMVPDFSMLGNSLLPMFEWANNGGKLFNVQPLDPTPITNTMMTHLGIEESRGVFTKIGGLKMNTDFMIGSKDFEYIWNEEDIMVISLRLTLTKNNIVNVESDNRIPLLWEHQYGKGTVVVNNLGLSGRDSRGYFAAAYSLLQDAFAYPVINSSAFFIDDFPAPVPRGYNEYITKFYNRDVESFFVNVWWPDMIDFAKRYGITYTGVLVEDYTDKTTAPFVRNADVSRFTSFGNTLLNMGGEIGYHGYSHQPLCYGEFDFMGKVKYNTWGTVEDSLLAFNEMADFGAQMFPENTFSTYVPPSNILSKEGRDMLITNFPQIKILSGLYQVEDYEFQQEFDISDDGIINVPRVISGTEIKGYEKWIALNELNFHYVNTHFFHPDDVLDIDRGAERGWSTTLSQFEEYVSWLYDVAPNIRNQTASDAGKAVQRYDSVTVQRTLKDNRLIIDINNFYDSSYLVVRIKDGKPGAVSGGSLEEVATGLYILSATSGTVEIEIVR
ncbi:MAG: DUF2194 domain-containing protein, partial [Oscillospiraceae bacterium]